MKGMLSVVAVVAGTNGVAAFVVVPPCGLNPGSQGCYVDANFSAGCAAVGGGILEHGPTSDCVVAGPIDSKVQFLPCNGGSCYGIGVKNYTVGCQDLGGFISGALSSGASPICTVPGGVTQFQACPVNTSLCSINTDFEASCKQLGGFIDGSFGPSPSQAECVVRGAASVFQPCDLDDTGAGCSFSTANFKSVCDAVNGVVTAIADNLPVCITNQNVQQIPPCTKAESTTGCTYNSANFNATCMALGGALLGSISTGDLPTCVVATK